MSLDRAEIGDGEIAILLDHPAIRQLYLGGSGLTDEGTKILRGLPQLGWLELSDTAITDVSIHTLSGMEVLQHLFLYGCQITDDCSPDLISLTNLREVGLDDTLISTEGLKRVSRALPGIKIS